MEKSSPNALQHSRSNRPATDNSPHWGRPKHLTVEIKNNISYHKQNSSKDTFSNRQFIRENKTDLSYHPQLSKESVDYANYANNSIMFAGRKRVDSLDISMISKDEANSPHLMITDVAMHFDELNEFDQVDTEESRKFFSFINPEIWFLLILLAIIVPMISISFSFLSEGFLTNVLHHFLTADKTLFNFFSLLLISIVFAFTSCTICYFHSDAEGSGIPELKSTLAGLALYKYFSFRTLILKAISLFFSIGSGLFVGREGPFVHISAAVAYNLAKIPYFKRVHSKNTFKKQILATAGGIGITATFGTPIGGCLYSIETMSTFFPVHAFWKSFFCSFICAMIFHLMVYLLDIELFKTTNFLGF